MIRYVIVSSKEENIKGYKQIIDKEMMRHDICYRYCSFNNNDKSFKSYCSLKNASTVFIIDNDDQVIREIVKGDKEEEELNSLLKRKQCQKNRIKRSMNNSII